MYRKEVRRLEGVQEQAEVEIRSLKEDLVQCEEKNLQIQEEKQTGTATITKIAMAW